MDTVVWILAGLFVLNVAIVVLAGFVMEVRRHRQAREIRLLESLWRAPVAVPRARQTRRVSALVREHPTAPVATITEPPGLLRKASFVLAVASLAGATVAALIDPGGLRPGPATGTLDLPRFFGDGGLVDRGTDGSAVADPVATAEGPLPTAGLGPSVAIDGPVAVVVQAEPTSATAIHIDWDDVAEATGYRVVRWFDGSHGNGRWRPIAETAKYESAYTDTGLAADTTYFYRVQAVTPQGVAPPSDVVSATTSVAPPIAPELKAEPGSGVIVLTWTDVESETGYRVERMAPNETEWTSIATTGEDVTTYEDAGLEAETTYSFRVVATGEGGDSEPSNVATATAPGVGSVDPGGGGDDADPPTPDGGGGDEVPPTPDAGGDAVPPTPDADGEDLLPSPDASAEDPAVAP